MRVNFDVTAMRSTEENQCRQSAAIGDWSRYSSWGMVLCRFCHRPRAVVLLVANMREKGRMPSLAISCFTLEAVKVMTRMLPNIEMAMTAAIVRFAMSFANTRPKKDDTHVALDCDLAKITRNDTKVGDVDEEIKDCRHGEGDQGVLGKYLARRPDLGEDVKGLLPAAVAVKDEEEGVGNAGNVVDRIFEGVVQLEIVGCL